MGHEIPLLFDPEKGASINRFNHFEYHSLTWSLRPNDIYTNIYDVDILQVICRWQWPILGRKADVLTRPSIPTKQSTKHPLVLNHPRQPGLGTNQRQLLAI